MKYSDARFWAVNFLRCYVPEFYNWFGSGSSFPDEDNEAFNMREQMIAVFMYEPVDTIRID
jgi:hypothetical protein